MNLAAIITSTVCDVKNWTDKTLTQIEIYGSILYRDIYLDSKVLQLTIDDFPRHFYIDHTEHKLFVSKNRAVHHLKAQSLAEEIKKEFSNGNTLCVLIGSYSFSIIKSGEIFFWFDPNDGIADPKNEIRSTARCFSSVDSMIGYILTLGPILKSTKFSVTSVRCQKI